jgi:5'-phosphate synthase pdxT subunit
MGPAVHIGVLALQGDFERHLFHLKRLDVPAEEVRKPSQLDTIDGLIIPGGESTTMTELIDRFAFRDKLTAFFKNRAVWGTCAGSILLAREVDDPRVKPFGIIDLKAVRNGYGRQVHSFFSPVRLNLNGCAATIDASFIRAPLFEEIGSGVEILAIHENRPILLRQNRCLVSSFHSELHDNPVLTAYFIDYMVRSKLVLNKK